MKLTKIGDFLKRSKIPIDILDNEYYSRVTIRINHNGVSLRDNEVGKKIGTKKQFILKAGQFIVSKIDARYGAFGIAPDEVNDAIITGNFWAYDVDFNKLNIEWFNQFTNSPDFYDLCERASAGITHRKYLNESFFLNYEIMLPSVEEQLIQIDKIKLQKISFGELTSELTHQLDLIKQLRQAFLREAMQGKLLTSVTSSAVEKQATGHELLAQIKAEKAQLIAAKKLKKEKELPPITADEIPFEIPWHWAWCRLGEAIYDTDSGKSPNCLNQSVKNDQWGVIKTTAVQELFFLENENKILPENFIVNEQYKIYEGDILITRAGPKNRVGVVCCVEKLTRNLILSDKTIRLKFSKELLSPRYFTIALNSPLIKKVIEQKMTGMADSQVNITQENIKNFPIPLPPLNEQEQIVAKLEELMSFCDGLEQSIKESQGYNKMLLQQVLREALQPKEEVKVISIQAKKLQNPLKTVLAAHIVNTCNTRDFGRVKFQKLLFLVEYFCKIDFESKYVKKAAGPYDYQLIQQIEQDFKRMNFFKVEQDKSDNHRVTYTPRSASSEIKGFFLENFPDESVKINSILMKMRPLSWSECEIVATIFAVWNNRLIKKELITDELLYEDFMAWSSRKSNLAKDFHRKLFWMKEEQIIPEGWGNYVDEPSL